MRGGRVRADQSLSSMDVIVGRDSNWFVLLNRNPDICAAELDGEICLFNPQSAAYLNLNSTGSSIWNLLETPTAINDLISKLQVLYAVDADTCRSETEHFVLAALDKGMLLQSQPV